MDSSGIPYTTRGKSIAQNPFDSKDLLSAIAIDFFLFFSILFFLLPWINPLFYFSFLFIFLFFLGFFIFFYLQWRFLKTSFGLYFSGARWSQNEKKYKKIRQPTRTLLFLCFLLFSFSFYTLHLQSFSTKKINEISLPEFQAGKSNLRENWIIAPFFYVMGAFPKKAFDGPLIYSIPYQKGPPEFFLPEILSYWKNPEVKFVFSGPKPTSLKASESLPCFEKPVGIFSACAKIRAEILAPYFKNLALKNKNFFQIQLWKTKKNQFMITLELKTSKKTYVESILLLPQKSTQSFSLSYPVESPDAANYDSLYRQTLSSLEAFETIDPGRVFANQKLANFSIPKKDRMVFSEAQALLASVLSVDPRKLEPYFHFQAVTKLLFELSPELTAITKPSIYTMSLYAKDLEPEGQKTLQMEQTWLRVKNLQ